MTRFVTLLLVLTVGCPSEDPIVVDAAFRDVVEDRPADPPPSPDTCEQRFSAIGLGIQGTIAADRRTLVALNLAIAPGEIVSIWLDALSLANGDFVEIAPVGVADASLLYGTDCPSLRIEECADFWVPESGTVYIEALDPTPGGEARVVVGDVLLVPARVDLRDYDGDRIEPVTTCRYLSAIDAGATLVTASCPAPACRLSER